jgi:predicted transcriptional regulator
MFWSSIEEEQFGKIPYVDKFTRLTEEGFIAKSFEPGSYSGYYITEKGKEYLSKIWYVGCK